MNLFSKQLQEIKQIKSPVQMSVFSFQIEITQRAILPSHIVLLPRTSPFWSILLKSHYRISNHTVYHQQLLFWSQHFQALLAIVKPAQTSQNAVAFKIEQVPHSFSNHLVQCLAQSRHSINIGWVNVLSFRTISYT